MKFNHKNSTPPLAKKLPKTIEMHGDKRADDFYWLRERENPEVIKYLEAENQYTKEVLAPLEDLQNELFAEIKGRIKEEDQSVPYFYNGYWYITRYEKGKEHPIYSRKKDFLENQEEILFDVNQLVNGLDYYELGAFGVSFDNKFAFYAYDELSRRIYTIRFKNLESEEISEDILLETTGNAVWAKDNLSLFYVKKDETLRPYRIYKHILGKKQEEDILVYEEKDKKFSCGLSHSKSREYIFIECNSTDASETLYLQSDKPNDAFVLFQKREDKLEYSVEHTEEGFLILTNADGATNYQLMRCPLNKTQKSDWEVVVPHRKAVLLEGLEIFESYLVLEERKKGLLQIQILPKDKQKTAYYLPFSEETYTAYTSTNRDYKSKKLRFVYTSFSTPTEVIEFDMEKQTQVVLKKQSVEDKNFSKNNYQTQRLWAKARDGKEIPISLVYNIKTAINEKTPLLLYGYGSYGYTVDPSFSISRLSILDRGFVFAIAHVRGGEYLGREWCEEGRLEHKKNTFYDFVDCAKYLIAEKHTSAEHLYAQGGSAGGLLMGAAVNFAPELFRGIISNVPFVDVLTTMLDESIPLTTGEYEEWGNPKSKEVYDYIKSYSPYDNLEDKTYPNLLVTSGLHDSQVQYWEPAKYVAKLRTLKNNPNLILLKTEMNFGHSGASGRFESIKEIALEWAFLLALEKN